MAQSKAKKLRMKQQQQGKLNPEMNRGSWNGIIPVERRMPTLAERREKQQHKHKNKWNRTLLNGSDGSIYFFPAGLKAYPFTGALHIFGAKKSI